MTVEQTLILTKTTKNTFVYSSQPGEVPKIRTVYVEQSALPRGPNKIRVTIEEVKEE